MKYLYYGLNVILILVISTILIVSSSYVKTSTVENGVKALQTSVLMNGVDTNEATNDVTDDSNSEEDTKDESSANTINNSLDELEENVSESVAESQVISDVLETLTGSMSAYELNGNNVGAGASIVNNYLYLDGTYGSVRVVAGDSSLPYGSIVRVKGSRLGEFYAIVLDRGSAIGKGRRHMFDLLFPSYKDAVSYGVERGLTFEVVRYGY